MHNLYKKNFIHADNVNILNTWKYLPWLSVFLQYEEFIVRATDLHLEFAAWKTILFMQQSLVPKIHVYLLYILATYFNINFE